jgi:hypothetical protein
MEADPFHTENKELGLLKKKRFDLFRFKTTIWKSTNNAEYTSLGTKLSRIPVAKYVQELGLRSKLSKKCKVKTNSAQVLNCTEYFR